MTIEDTRSGAHVIRFDSSLFDPADRDLFNPDWARANGHWRGSTPGRNQAHFLDLRGRAMVLRHFYRGGLIGRIITDRYLRTGARRSRSFREFDLLLKMQSIGLPVPRPVAARYSPRGAWYQADLITQRIPKAEPLQDILRAAPLPGALWSRIGATLYDMHAQGIYHSDLNARNILLDGDQAVWLIDFDKCEERAPGRWHSENLERLHRSLRKSKGAAEAFHWTDADWATLMEGYTHKGTQP